MITLENINKYYVVSQEKFHVLKDIQLTIESGEFVGIIGSSGSGKSTLINLIGFIDRNFKGNYFFEGEAIRNFNDNECSAIRNKSVGFVFQNFSLIENLTVRENIEIPLLYAGNSSKQVEEKVAEMLEKVGLPHSSGKYPRQLSGGQQQRVAIARAMIHSPKFLIADEPTGALDSKTSVEIMELFQQLHQAGVTIILVTHDLELLHYCTKIIRIKDGEIMVGDPLENK